MAHLQPGRHRGDLRRDPAGRVVLAGGRAPWTLPGFQRAGLRAILPLRFSILVPSTERLDRFLADQLSVSRTQAARLVAGGHVQVGGTPARASRQLARGEVVEVTLAPEVPVRPLVPSARPLDVVYQDDHLLVIAKPAGLVVHPAPGHWEDTLVNALVARGTSLSSGGAGGAPGRPGIVHRLDRDTSGLMVVARTDLAHRRLGAALAARRIRRRYAALAWGHFDASASVIDAPVGRHQADRKRMTVYREAGARARSARTEVYVVARLEAVDLLRLELHSGRTHQIRVHLEHVGHPVVGDPVYHGGGSRRITGALRTTADRIERVTPRQALHAAELAFRHPVSGEPLRFRSEWPEDLREALEAALPPDATIGADSVAGAGPLSYLGFFTDPDG